MISVFVMTLKGSRTYNLPYPTLQFLTLHFFFFHPPSSGITPCVGPTEVVLVLVKLLAHFLIIKDTSGFTSNTLLILKTWYQFLLIALIFFHGSSPVRKVVIGSNPSDGSSGENTLAVVWWSSLGDGVQCNGNYYFLVPPSYYDVKRESFFVFNHDLNTGFNFV